MAGGFSGMPLGSFSGRGADFQPFQFILEQRRLAAQAEAQRKQQAAAQQQSFVMALMAKKQQEAELAQRQAENQMQRDAVDSRFQAEQARLRDQENRRRDDALAMQRAALKTREEHDRRVRLERAMADTRREGAAMVRGALKTRAQTEYERRQVDTAAKNSADQWLAQNADFTFKAQREMTGGNDIQAINATEQALRQQVAELFDNPAAQADALRKIKAWADEKEKSVRANQRSLESEAKRAADAEAMAIKKKEQAAKESANDLDAAKSRWISTMKARRERTPDGRERIVYGDERLTQLANQFADLTREKEAARAAGGDSAAVAYEATLTQLRDAIVKRRYEIAQFLHPDLPKEIEKLDNPPQG